MDMTRFSRFNRCLRHLAGLALVVAVAGCANDTQVPFAEVPARGTSPVQPADPSARGDAEASAELIVLAAASLSEAFKEIGERFEAAHPGVAVAFSFGASSELATQIMEGAPADVFASANPEQMARLVEAGEVADGTAQTFARNRLTAIYSEDNPAGIETLQDLARPGLKLVLAAKAVPAGDYALQFLARASARPDFTAAYSETVLANVVSYEDEVRGVLGKVALGEADAGIVYASDLASTGGGQVGHIDLPDDLNIVAEYPISPIAASEQAVWAGRFVAYVLSEEGQAVLEGRGFER
jgi:molybdate transport system substrate-binding protein